MARKGACGGERVGKILVGLQRNERLEKRRESLGAHSEEVENGGGFK